MRKHMYTPTPDGIHLVANHPFNHASHAIPSTEYAEKRDADKVKNNAIPLRP